MGFRFRKRIKIAPGVSINVTSKGVTSASIGRRGASLNVGKNGVQASASIPNTGISYTKRLGKLSRKACDERSSESCDDAVRYTGARLVNTKEVSFPLAVGIFVMPYIFAWATLRGGYTRSTRLVSFGWLIFLVVILFQ